MYNKGKESGVDQIKDATMRVDAKYWI